MEVSAHLAVPLESFKPKDVVYRSGYGGVSIPTCVKCPVPEPKVPDIDLRELLKAHPQGATILLRFIVTADGHTRNIEVVQPVGFGFDEQLTKAAANWELSPAVDPDGKPVSVIYPFRFAFNFR